ncbi:hypothetical protein L6R53_03865 [Myxococcota bacterium]|nr:hypothetical protein [Myxococcota bacterium]
MSSLRAAAALRAGDPAAARDLVQTGWRFSPAQAEVVCQQLLQTPPAPDAKAWALAMEEGPGPDLPTALDWREEAWRRAWPDGAVGDPLAWGLCELAAHGWLLDQVERQPWEAVSAPPDPVEDREVGRLWSAWAGSRAWEIRDEWERRFLKPALRAFSAVLRGRRLPEDVRRRAIQDAREGFFYVLIGGADPGAGWRELAVRLLEASGGDPVDALAGALPAASWERVARCAVTRGHGRDTAAIVWGGGVAWQVQARDLERRGQARPQALGDLLDLHLALRLVDCWTSPAFTAPERGLSVMAHNRGRARSRLRAVLREAPAEHLLAQILARPGLAARTRSTVARFARDWAWQQVQHGFAFYDARTVDPACVLPEGSPPRLTEDEAAALRAWLVRVVVKARLPHLLQWVHGGDDLDKRDSTWGRLLADDCPASLRSYPGAARGEGLARMRAELSEHLPAQLRMLLPTLQAVAALDTRARDLEASFIAAVTPIWHADVELPRVRYRSYVESTREAMAAVERAANAPSDPEDG